MKKYIYSFFLSLMFLIAPGSFANDTDEVRNRELVVIIDQSFRERSQEITFTKDISFFEVFTFIFEKDIGIVGVIEVPGDFTDSKIWEVKAKAVFIDSAKVITVHDVLFNKNKIVKHIVNGVETTSYIFDIASEQGNHGTFYFQFKYKGKKNSITVPWDFKVGISKEVFKTNTGIKYRVNVREVR